ncbi:MAG: beta-propeller domain-containing protein, partial [Planctomycetia bacterium]
MDATANGLVGDAFEVHQNDDPQLFDVLANDVFGNDYAGQKRITSVSYGSEGGRVDISDDGLFLQYSPPADFAGSETFVYYVDNTLSATVTVSIDAPLNPDQYEILPTGEGKVLDVLANDPFWANYDGPGKITAVSTTALGNELTIAEDGKSLLYTPASDADGKDSFVYIVDGLYPAEVTINIPNPLTNDQFHGLVEQSENNILDVLSNDPFWDSYPGEKKITHIIGLEHGGELTIADDGKSIFYTPATDFYGSDSFTYVVDNMYEATVSLQVHHPVRDDSFEVDTNTVNFSQTLTDNDSFSYREYGHQIDRDVVDNITWVGETLAGGTVTIREDGQGVYYSAPAGFEGTDTFDYIADGKYRATVTVNVTSPVRNDYSRSFRDIYEDTTGNVLDVLANDFIGNGYDGPRIITAVGETISGGTVTIAADGRSLIYTPGEGFRGTDTFTYTVDGQYQAKVYVKVSALADGDSYKFYSDPTQTEWTLDVLADDHFDDSHYSGPGIITAVGATQKGSTVTISEDGKSIRFILAAGGVAENYDTFTYTVDGQYEATVRVSFYDCLDNDLFVVDQNSTDVVLTPLENDFKHWNDGTRHHAPYDGPRLISSATAEHGTVTVAADGKTLLYTAVGDFTGQDKITYTVDGVMQETAEVQVIRRVRDDQYYVEAGSSENVLPVLVNDLFGADYTGAGLITSVTATEAGGTVTISEDGKSIYYTPPANGQGFTGEDRFTYMVDGQLKAEVVINVEIPAAELLSQFDSIDEFKEWLIADALQRYEDLFGQEVTVSPPWLYDAVGASVSIESGRSHSDTNVQVDGVDEGDLIENDGTYLYVLADGQLVITKAWPAMNMRVASCTDIEGEAIAMYLNGDRLTVISRIPTEVDPGYNDPFRLESTIYIEDAGYWFPGPSYTYQTAVCVFDVSNPKSPQMVEQTVLDGNYVESRRIDDTVFVVQRENSMDFRLPEPERTIVENPEDSADTTNESEVLLRYSSTYVYETREEYLARMEAEIDALVDEMFPHAYSYDADGNLIADQWLVSPEDMFGAIGGGNLVSVVSLDMGDDVPGIVASTGVLTSGADVIYGTMDHLYLFDATRTAEDGTVTQIMQFDWNATSGNVELTSVGQVVGEITDQFSVDEYDGYLRIATTIDNTHSGNWSERSENMLFVLRSDHGVMENVGSLQNLALDETIRSVRFLGDRAFVTTFRDIDPLSVLDLSDPADPTSLGHVTMPGYSTYMQVIDANHILAVGQNTPTRRSGPVQITLFDVSDLAHPQVVDSYTFERFSTSEAQDDHHAFGWFAEHQTLALPVARSYWERVDTDSDGYRESRVAAQEDALFLFHIDVTASSLSGDGIALLGQIDHETPVLRGAYIEDRLYSVANDAIYAVSITDPSICFSQVHFDDGLNNESTGQEINSADIVQSQKDTFLRAFKPLFVGPAMLPTGRQYSRPFQPTTTEYRADFPKISAPEAVDVALSETKTVAERN